MLCAVFPVCTACISCPMPCMCTSVMQRNVPNHRWREREVVRASGCWWLLTTLQPGWLFVVGKVFSAAAVRWWWNFPAQLALKGNVKLKGIELCTHSRIQVSQVKSVHLNSALFPCFVLLNAKVGLGGKRKDEIGSGFGCSFHFTHMDRMKAATLPVKTPKLSSSLFSLSFPSCETR